MNVPQLDVGAKVLINAWSVKTLYIKEFVFLTVKAVKSKSKTFAKN